MLFQFAPAISSKSAVSSSFSSLLHIVPAKCFSLCHVLLSSSSLCTLSRVVPACSTFFQLAYLVPCCSKHVLHSSSLCTLSRVIPACSTFFQLVYLAPCCSSMFYILPACAPCPMLFPHVLPSSSLRALFQTVPGCFTPFTDKLSALYMLIQLPVFPLFPFCFSFNGPVQQYKELQTHLQQC